MSTIWSSSIQGADMLFRTRSARFADEFAPLYRAAFRIANHGRILEIGCGPGALTQSLKRWYPGADVIGLDRDEAFLRYAAERAPGIRFMPGDATALFFPDDFLDVTISNTVQEHVEPSAFFGEQLRVLKPGGICLVLSARRTIAAQAECIRARTDFEREVAARLNAHDAQINARYSVCAHPMSEAELPTAMEGFGFRNVTTDYLPIALTPDHPECSPARAESILAAWRQTELDQLLSPSVLAAGVATEAELSQMRDLANARHDARLALYRAGKKQWDTTILILMVLRGEK